MIVGNLPYYAAIPILFATIGAGASRLVYMVQKEVAARLVAKPATPDYGQISVKLQMLADLEIALRVGRGVVFTGKNGKQYFMPDTGFNELFDLNADLRITAKDLDAVEGALGNTADEF